MTVGVGKVPDKKKPKDYHLKKQVNLRLDDDLYDALGEFAEKHKRPRRLVIEDAIREYLKANAHKASLEDQN